MLKAVLKFLRVRILVTCYAIVYIGSAASGAITSKTILSIFVLAAWYIHAASSNDYSDRDIDVVNLKNAKDRPLLTNDISYRQLWIIHFLAGAMAMALSAFYGTVAIAITAGMLVLDYAYSFKPVRISDRGILSQLLLAVAYVFYPFSLGYLSSSTHGSYPTALLAALYIGFVARLLLKDFRDVKGDKQFGKMTFLLRHGAKRTTALSGLLWFISLLVVGYATSFSSGMLIVLVFGFIQVAVLLRDLAKAPEIEDQNSLVALIAKGANYTVITILAYYLCKNQVGISAREVQLVPAILGSTLLITNWLRYKNNMVSNRVRSA